MESNRASRAALRCLVTLGLITLLAMMAAALAFGVYRAWSGEDESVPVHH